MATQLPRARRLENLQRSPQRRPLPRRPLPARPVTGHAPAPVARRRPDPSGMRLVIGLGGLAASTALISTFLAPTPASSATLQPAAAPAAPVQHVTRYVTLQPGQTAPPQSTVARAPAPTPRTIVVTTRQSGLP